MHFYILQDVIYKDVFFVSTFECSKMHPNLCIFASSLEDHQPGHSLSLDNAENW